MDCFALTGKNLGVLSEQHKLFAQHSGRVIECHSHKGFTMTHPTKVR
jgi:hypothetical protein